MTFSAVIFDFGGVITSSPFEAFNRLEAERGLPHNFVRGINATNPDTNAWALFERAEIDAATFDTLFAEEARALGHDLEGEAVLAVLAGAVPAAPPEPTRAGLGWALLDLSEDHHRHRPCRLW